MLKSKKAFSSFSVNDLNKAKEFYQNTLGLDVSEGEMGILEINIAGAIPIMIYPKPDHSPASFTVLNFLVDNIEQTVQEFNSKGIEFEQYDFDGLKTDEKGISRGNGPTIAWFKDPAGNILSILEE